MRRAVVLVLVTLLLTACATSDHPAGADGDLIDGWPMMPAAALIAPAAPACYPLPDGMAAADVTRWPAPVACTEPHEVELVSVGQFTGADAERSHPPAPGSQAMRTAYADCAADAATLLGGDWRTGRLALSVDAPGTVLWDAGARWYRCDLQALRDIDRFTIAKRTSSLKGALQPGGELLIGCVKVSTAPGGDVNGVSPAGCAEPHEGEFAGIFEPAAGTYPADAAARRDANLAGCRPKVAEYVGVPDDANFRSRTGLVTLPFDQHAWELGNRGVRCFVWPPKPVTSSLKGAGTKALPITVAKGLS